MVNFEWKVLDQWANKTLDNITDIMFDRDITVTPASLVHFTREEFGLDLDVDIADQWLQEQDWYVGISEGEN